MAEDLLISDEEKLEQIWGKAAAHLAPPPSLLTSEWAEQERSLTKEVSARPGMWNNDNAPYLVEPMDLPQLEPWIDSMYMQKASRLGGTEIVNNIMGRRIQYDPTSILYVQQSQGEVLKYSDTILKTFIENCPAVEKLLTVDNSFFKRFPGGNINLAGAQTPKAFRMLEKEIVIVDDIDGFPVSVKTGDKDEGDPISLAFKRCANNPNRLKIAISSPTIKGYSPIESLMETSDKRRWQLPCPICGYEQELKWGGPDMDFGVKWEGRDPATAYYLCESCHGKIQHYQKFEMNLKGTWRKTAQPNTPNIAGYYFSQLFSNFVTWRDMVIEFLSAGRDKTKLQVFVNTGLGDVFEEEYEKVEEHSLKQRREEYGPQIPMKACILTAFTDVQHDRLETKVVAWGPGKEAWVMEYKVIEGDPLLDEVWKKVQDYLREYRKHESGLEFRVHAAGFDSGYLTDRVYDFVRPRKHWNFVATKGANITGKPIIPESKSKAVWKDKKVHLYEIGVDNAKTNIHRRLLLKTAGPYYIHFYLNAPPGCQPLEDYYFTGLTAEKRVNVSKTHGRPKLEWRLREKGIHNEQLDLMVGNLAMLDYLIGFHNVNLADRSERIMKRAAAGPRAPANPRKAQAQGSGRKGRGVRNKGVSMADIMGKKK